jgi:NADH-quinone oxidoreductase subunit G
MAAFDGLGGAALDANPFAGNLADICPVGAITAKALRFRKRAWYLRPVPTISRHGADAKPVWADVDQNRVWRLRPRVESPDGTDSPARFITDEERWAFERYGRHGRAEGPVAPTLGGSAARARDIARALEAGGPVAVVAQGAFGCGALQALAGLATSDSLRYAHGNRRIPVHSQAMQGSDDGAINRAGAIAAGYRFGALPERLSRLEAWEVKSVVLYHDAWFSNDAENALLGRVLEKAVFSVLLEPVPSGLAGKAKATLPVTTYLEESDSIMDHRGAARHYEKAVEPPPGALTPAAWAAELVGADEIDETMTDYDRVYRPWPCAP